MVIYALKGIIVTMDHKGVIFDGVVIIDSDSGLIIDIGKSDIIKEHKPEIIIGDKNSIVMPGLINTHTHSPMSILRGLVSNISGFRWLKRVWKIEGMLKPSDVYMGSLMSIVCMVKSGTTTFADHYFYAEEIAKAVEEAGIRAVIAKTVIEYSEYAPKHNLKDSVSFAIRYHGKADGRILTMIGVHSIYSCSLETVKEAIEYSKVHDKPIHIHLAESRDEIKYVQGKYGTTPIKLAEKIGLLKVKPLIAHAAYVGSEEIPLLAKYQVKVAYAPFTKMRGGQEIAPVVEMLEAGVEVSLATDGPLSSGDLDMFKEMKFMLAAQNYRYSSPSALEPKEVIKAATINAAKNLGLDRRIGSIREGKVADIIVLKPDPFKVMPITDIYYTIVYSLCSSDVDTVFINGKPVMMHRKILTVNEKNILRNTLLAAERLRSSL
ncbi:MAG: hypothetical protein DRO23_07780 [Thermoprotei archaeon]|nr:MAG: hypothetical protein DRO23_07780 [Thermoprotei archaeon]